MAIQFWRKTLISLLAIAFVVSPIWSLVIEGVFGWHVKQPAAWQGGLELIALMIGIALSLAFLRKWKRWGIVLALMWLYARHHGVDLAIVIDYLYLEGMFAIGWHILPVLKCKRSNKPEIFLISGIMGTIVWSLCIWVLSLAGLGSAFALQWAALVILGISLATSRGPRLASMLKARLGPSLGMSAVFNALTITTGLLLFAKSAVSVSYDSMWYGLNAGHVLVGSGNIFTSEGLAAPVHYYPKLFEALQIPLVGVSSIPAIIGLSIMGWILTLYTSNLILKEVGVGARLRPAIISLIGTVPALANIAITTKGDSFGAWLMSTAVLGLIHFWNERSARWFWVAACSALLSTQARLSNIPYAVVLLILLIVSAVLFTKKPRFRELIRLINSRSILIFFFGLILTALITYRTIKLAGVPIIGPDTLVDILSGFGVNLSFPVGRLPAIPDIDHVSFLQSLFWYLFDPRRFIGIELGWTANIWLFLPILAMLYGFNQWRQLRATWLVLIVGLAFFPVLMKYNTSVGLDGNYFVTPVICLIIFGAAMLQYTLTWKEHHHYALWAIFFAFAFSMAGITLVTGSWGPGTRAFDDILDRTPFDYPVRQRAALKNVHLDGAALFFAAMPPDTRVVGSIESDGWWLPVRYEPLKVIAWARRNNFANASNVVTFLKRDLIQYLLIGRNDSPGSFEAHYSNLLREVAIVLQRDSGAHIAYSDSHFEIWHLTTRAPDDILSEGTTLSLQIEGSGKCILDKPFSTKVSWRVESPPVQSINIYVRGPTADKDSLWSSAGNEGSSVTGPWAVAGMQFIIRDAKNSKTILGTRTLLPDCDP